MKKIILSILTLALPAAIWAQPLDRSIRPKPGPAPEVKIGSSENFTLPNGLKVFVVENHKLPTISCDIVFDIKPGLEKDEAGYKQMLSELLLTGTKTRTNDQLNEQIDFIGANIAASSEGISGGSLTKHEDKLFDLMSDITMNAVFKQDELDKIKTRTLSGLETQKNDPDAMLSNVTSALDYGPAHPYGEVVTDETVKNVKLKSCEDYYNTYFRPNVAYMAIVGDITVKQAKSLVEKYFGKWQKSNVPTTTYGHYDAPDMTRVAFVPREASVQSVINVTYPIDLKPGNDDVIKARVTNTILGGGSQGRLFLDLREKHGWTYGAYSSIRDDDQVGNFTAYAKCRNAVTDSSVGAILDEMKRLQNEKVNDSDLQNSIAYMSGNFAISLEDPARIAQFAINIERYHMPKDYYADYLKNMSKVSVDDVQFIARKYIKPANANIIVVGSKDEAGKLSKYGDVSYYDNYGNPIKVSTMAAAPSNVSADDVVKKYINAIGGEKAISDIKDIKTVSKGEIHQGPQTIQLTITEMKKVPGKWKQTVEAMGMVVQKEVLNGDKGYQEAQGQKADLTGDELEGAKQEADFQADLHPEKYGIKRTIKGMEKVNGSDAYVIEEVDAKGKKSTEYYDVQSGFLVKKTEMEETPQGSFAKTQELSDYKEVPGSGGYKVPYTVKESEGPQAVTVQVESVEINKNIPDTEFN
ncbi:MAG TPA: insulinase family protein [Flavipsychrobacter sp.]|nr:insulinase family protein [Flavipsychrobacter sp.]